MISQIWQFEKLYTRPFCILGNVTSFTPKIEGVLDDTYAMYTVLQHGQTSKCTLVYTEKYPGKVVAKEPFDLQVLTHKPYLTNYMISIRSFVYCSIVIAWCIADCNIILSADDKRALTIYNLSQFNNVFINYPALL